MKAASATLMIRTISYSHTQPSATPKLLVVHHLWMQSLVEFRDLELRDKSETTDYSRQIIIPPQTPLTSVTLYLQEL